jgi:hypothetical protein
VVSGGSWTLGSFAQCEPGRMRWSGRAAALHTATRPDQGVTLQPAQRGHISTGLDIGQGALLETSNVDSNLVFRCAQRRRKSGRVHFDYGLSRGLLQVDCGG